jgi:hypothetical protein
MKGAVNYREHTKEEFVALPFFFVTFVVYFFPKYL